MSKGAVLLISYHFYPSSEVGAKRPSETALFLQRNGFDVTVLRGRDYSDPANEVPPGLGDLRIVSVAIPRRWITELWLKLKQLRGRRRSGSAAASAARSAKAPGPIGPIDWLRRQVAAFEGFLQCDKRWFCKCVVRILWLRVRRRFDVVVASGPPMAGYACGVFAATVLRAPLILDFRDPWYLHGDPERKSAAPGHVFGRLENRLAHVCVSRASQIVVASPGIERHLRESFALDGKRIDLVRNGFDEHAAILEPPPAGRLAMLYAGTLYWNRNPFPFLSALATVCADPAVARKRISLKLVGRCAEWGGTPLAPWLRENGIDDVVSLIPTIPSSELRRLVVESNVLVNFAQGQPRQIPAKSYEYIASRREVLTIAERDSDVADLFREVGAGAFVQPDDSEGMARCIRAFYDELAVRGKVAAATQNVVAFSRASQLARFLTAIDSTIHSVA